MTQRILGIFVFLIYHLSFSENLPAWVDTVSPTVRLLPEKRIQKTPFVVSFTASKQVHLFYASSINGPFSELKTGLSIAREGTFLIYYYGEDLFGNKTPVDSAVFLLDCTPPHIYTTPGPGVYQTPVSVRFKADEPCDFFLSSDPSGKTRVGTIGDSIRVDSLFSGFLFGIDRAGNRSRTPFLQYCVDSTTTAVSIAPYPGLYNRMVYVRFATISPGVSVFYSLDPLAPPEWFTQYTDSVPCSYGFNLVRYFGRSASGRESPMTTATYIIDTVAPRIRAVYTTGKSVDTLALVTKKKSVIRMVATKTANPDSGQLYFEPILIPHAGRARIIAVARDSAGNRSPLLVWEHRYDTISPRIVPSHVSGVYQNPFTLAFSLSKPATLFYTLDGSLPSDLAPKYTKGIPITKNGETTVRFFAKDTCDNITSNDSLIFVIDNVPPTVRVVLEGEPAESMVRAILTTDEPAIICWESGTKTPTRQSPRYKEPIKLAKGQEIRYRAWDRAGNASKVGTLDDAAPPVISARPSGGLFKPPLSVRLSGMGAASISYRISPDSQFVQYKDSIILLGDGVFPVEWYGENSQGRKSIVKRQEYVLDSKPPQPSLIVRKESADSVTLFFSCSEPSAIFYTLDGTDPIISRSAQYTGNKVSLIFREITIPRTESMRVRFFAEDMAGNRSVIYSMNISKPEPIPSRPGTGDRIYNEMIDVALMTLDENAIIYYERNNKEPTRKSPKYTSPLLFLSSDTVKAFALDAFGFQGEVKTFIYRIDLPPVPRFIVTPSPCFVDTSVRFIATGSTDQETPIGELVFSWDFDGDKRIDTTGKALFIVNHKFTAGGRYHPVLTVRDKAGQSVSTTVSVDILGDCPAGMRFVSADSGRSFCIDSSVWRQTMTGKPRTMVSWIQASLACQDVGKRLCTHKEWQYACEAKTLAKTGNARDDALSGSKASAAEGGLVVESYREESAWNNGFGVADMTGNIREWVGDLKNGYGIMVGAFSATGTGVHGACSMTLPAVLNERNKETGFRCCK